MSEVKIINSHNQRAVVRISIPYRVAQDGKLMKKSLSKLAESIGHQTCFSGVDCLFRLQRDFIVDENLAIKNIAETDPEGSPALKFKNVLGMETRLVTANLSDKEMMS